MTTGVEDQEKIISDTLKTMAKVEKKLASQGGKVNTIRKRMEKTYAALMDLETLKKKEIEELQAEKILLEEILPWKFIIKSELEELQRHCEEYGLSPRGDKASLRDRLMRHILKINLPAGELLLEGKLNINTATSDEMSLWPYMGGTLVKNIIAYRQKYDKFYKIEDLMNVKGVGRNLFKKLVQFVDVAGKTHIKVKSGTRAEADMELIKLEDEIRNKAWELQDLKDHLEIDIDYLSGITKGLGEERERIGENFGDIEEFQAKLEVTEKELQLLKENMANQIDELEAIKANNEEQLIAREQEMDSKAEMLKEYEQKLNEIRYGVGANIDDMEAETVDLPVIVQRDPEDKNPEDDRVILDSTDGYIRRAINVYFEGQAMEGDYSRVVFKNIPVNKSYNILVDTGERRYFLMKNFNPGGAA
jgi:competence ComEA-like helix-hairpin-helix protein